MIIENILKDIQSAGFSVQEIAFTSDHIEDLRGGVLNAYHNNSSESAFKRAGVGRDPTVQEDIRGDRIHWLQKEKLNPSQQKVWDFLETLKNHFNKELFLGLKDFETHMTVYPKNTFYKKHIDQFKDSNGDKIRKISFIIYLNEEWTNEDGGQLNLYDTNDQEKIVRTVIPKSGRAVFFLSADFPHEVLETKKERVSMTGWFYT